MACVPVTSDFFISGQIMPEQVQALADQGFTALINNRPDGEEPGQPASAIIEAAARAAGLDYVHAPMHGAQIREDDITRIHQVTRQPSGKVLGFCRSGARSMLGWALAQSQDRSADDVIALAREAGHDLSPFRSAFESRYSSGA
ncbi:TIGR01244 family sulfur transferase [Oceanicaulis sp.]|jgi:sulfide:quinone oxidoreductase|uniref:TIGR01244 family sulfur transferase n=1 Tax=Oceanicaulis sp. TaxID=1924941 RepID=UPI000D317935